MTHFVLDFDALDCVRSASFGELPLAESYFPGAQALQGSDIVSVSALGTGGHMEGNSLTDIRQY